MEITVVARVMDVKYSRGDGKLWALGYDKILAYRISRRELEDLWIYQLCRIYVMQRRKEQMFEKLKLWCIQSKYVGYSCPSYRTG